MASFLAVDYAAEGGGAVVFPEWTVDPLSISESSLEMTSLCVFFPTSFLHFRSWSPNLSDQMFQSRLLVRNLCPIPPLFL